MNTALTSILNFTSPIYKSFREGTDRLTIPEQTVVRISPVMARIGITRVTNVTGLDTIGIPVAVAVRPNARSLSVSQGKGLDLVAAKASALMESIEMYHSEHVNSPLKLGSYKDLIDSHRLVDISYLPHVVGSPFHPCFPILWIEGVDLFCQEPIWVPYEMVHTNYTFPLPTGSGCFFSSTNGLASGNHLLEAISHGICEVVERDATTLWNLLSEADRDKTRVDLNTISDSSCCQVLEKYAQAGVAVGIWELTTDIGIPTFLCRIADRVWNPLHSFYPAEGSGCHPLRQIALLRALTEAAQSRLTQVAGSRDDRLYSEYACLQSSKNQQGAIHELMHCPTSPRSFQDSPSWDVETFNKDIAWEMERLHEAGITQLIVVNLTKPEIGIPVVRVIIPGLESIGFEMSGKTNAVLGKRAQLQIKKYL